MLNILSKKYFNITATILFAYVSSCDVYAAQRVIPFEHWQTQNGSHVYFDKISELPIVDIKIGFYAGSAFDGKQSGLANLTSSLLFEGTGSFTSNDIANQFDRLGSLYSASTDRDYTIVSLRSLTDKTKLTPAFHLFTQSLTHPTFSDKDFSRIKSETLADLTHQDEKPDSIAEKQFYATVFSGTPYATPIKGNAKIVSTITRSDCEAFYRSHYTAKNSVIVIVGDLDIAQAKDIAEKLSHELPQGEKPPTPNDKDPLMTKRETHVYNHPSMQSSIRIGELGIARNSPDMFALKVGNYTLGGGSMTSRLTNEVREKRGLSYSVYSYFAPFQNKGPFVIGLQTKNSQTNQAIDVTQNTFSHFLKNGPSEDELRAAKQYLTGSFALYFGNNNDIATQLLGLGLQEMPQNYFDTYIDKVNAVTQEDIKNAFGRTLSENRLVTIVVGPKASIEQHPFQTAQTDKTDKLDKTAETQQSVKNK